MDASINKIAGVLFGHAFGDAVAQSTKLAVVGTMPEFPRLKCDDNTVALNDWGYATDHLLLTIQSITTGESLSSLLSKYGSRDEPAVLKHIISLEGFAADACGTANSVWEQTGRKLATSAAMSRAIACGISDDPVNNAISYTCITDADVRCLQAAACLALIIRAVVAGDITSVINECVSVCDNEEILACLRTDMTLAELELDIRPDHITKALSCAVYAIKIITTAEDKKTRPCIKKIAFKFAACRGRSDVNTGIVCAIIGAYVGFNAISEDLILLLPRHNQLRENLGLPSLKATSS